MLHDLHADYCLVAASCLQGMLEISAAALMNVFGVAGYWWWLGEGHVTLLWNH